MEEEQFGRLPSIRAMEYAKAIRDRDNQSLTPAQRGAAKRAYNRLVKHDKQVEEWKQDFLQKVTERPSVYDADTKDAGLGADELIADSNLSYVSHLYGWLSQEWDDREQFIAEERIAATQDFINYLTHMLHLMRGV